MRLLSACCALVLGTLPTGCGSSSAPPTLKPTPELALVTNYGTHTGQPYTVSAFALNPGDGVLTQISGSPFSVGSAPNSLAVDPAVQELLLKSPARHLARELRRMGSL